MLAILLEGKKVAQSIKDRLKEAVVSLKENGARAPALACIAVGDNPASSLYIKSQSAVARELGIEYKLISLKEGIAQKDLISEIKKLNIDKGTDAMIIQTPLPKNFVIDEVVSFMSPAKDAEGVHPENLGRVFLGNNRISAPTAAACMELLRYYGIKFYGKEAVIVGHSNIVGKPLALMLLNEFATTTICHIATSDVNKLEEHVLGAEILIVAAGKPHLIKGDWVKEKAIVVDVGINKVGDKILGDVEFEVAFERAAYITPVPGGVGPLTVAMLMKNVIELAKSCPAG